MNACAVCGNARKEQLMRYSESSTQSYCINAVVCEKRRAEKVTAEKKKRSKAWPRPL